MKVAKDVAHFHAKPDPDSNSKSTANNVDVAEAMMDLSGESALVSTFHSNVKCGIYDNGNNEGGICEE